MIYDRYFITKRIIAGLEDKLSDEEKIQLLKQLKVMCKKEELKIQTKPGNSSIN